MGFISFLKKVKSWENWIELSVLVRIQEKINCFHAYNNILLKKIKTVVFLEKILVVVFWQKKIPIIYRFGNWIPLPKKDREIKLKMIDTDYEKSLEQQISEYIQNNLSFVVFEVNTKDERLFWESKIISTLAQSNEIKPSENWLGNHSPKDKIKQSGLWQVNELNKAILTTDEFDELVKLVG